VRAWLLSGSLSSVAVCRIWLAGRRALDDGTIKMIDQTAGGRGRGRGRGSGRLDFPGDMDETVGLILEGAVGGFG
jgi:hypothetical protein